MVKDENRNEIIITVKSKKMSDEIRIERKSLFKKFKSSKKPPIVKISKSNIQT